VSSRSIADFQIVVPLPRLDAGTITSLDIHARKSEGGGSCVTIAICSATEDSSTCHLLHVKSSSGRPHLSQVTVQQPRLQGVISVAVTAADEFATMSTAIRRDGDRIVLQ